MTMTGRGHHLYLFKQFQANRKVFRSKSGLMPPRSGIQKITLRVKNNDPNTNSQRQGQQPRRKRGHKASTRMGTINSFGGNNLSYVTAHLLIAEARLGQRSVQFSSFTPRCRQAQGAETAVGTHCVGRAKCQTRYKPLFFFNFHSLTPLFKLPHAVTREQRIPN